MKIALNCLPNRILVFDISVHHLFSLECRGISWLSVMQMKTRVLVEFFVFCFFFQFGCTYKNIIPKVLYLPFEVESVRMWGCWELDLALESFQNLLGSWPRSRCRVKLIGNPPHPTVPHQLGDLWQVTQSWARLCEIAILVFLLQGWLEDFNKSSVISLVFNIWGLSSVIKTDNVA